MKPRARVAQKSSEKPASHSLGCPFPWVWAGGFGVGPGSSYPRGVSTPWPRSRGCPAGWWWPRLSPKSRAWGTHSNILQTKNDWWKPKLIFNKRVVIMCQVLGWFIMLLQGHVALNCTKPGWSRLASNQKFLCLRNQYHGFDDLLGHLMQVLAKPHGIAVMVLWAQLCPLLWHKGWPTPPGFTQDLVKRDGPQWIPVKTSSHVKTQLHGRTFTNQYWLSCMHFVETEGLTPESRNTGVHKPRRPWTSEPKKGIDSEGHIPCWLPNQYLIEGSTNILLKKHGHQAWEGELIFPPINLPLIPPNLARLDPERGISNLVELPLYLQPALSHKELIEVLNDWIDMHLQDFCKTLAGGSGRKVIIQFIIIIIEALILRSFLILIDCFG